MSESTKGFSRTIFAKGIKYGGLGNLLLISGLILFYFLFDNVLFNIKNLTVFIMVIFMFFAVKEFRSQNGNLLMFWQGVFVSISTFLVYVLTSMLIIYIYTKIIDPGALEIYISFKLESLDKFKEMVGDEKYQAYYQQTKELNPFTVAIENLVTLMYTGIFSAMIIAAVLRKAPGVVQ